MLPFDANQDKAQQIEILKQQAHKVLESYCISLQSIELVNYEYNATFKILDQDQNSYALRINVNSKRSKANGLAEISFIQHLQAETDINVPTPIANLSGSYLTEYLYSPDSEKMLCVLYKWLAGEEVGDNPSELQLISLGQAMAKMHIATESFELPDGANLPIFQDPLWQTINQFSSDNDLLDSETLNLIEQTFKKIQTITNQLYSTNKVQVIHADLHGWNLMWHKNEIAIFDFDDCGFGLALQDLAVALYYLDTHKQREALVSGYNQIKPLPPFSELELETLLMQRRLILLNYLFGTTNPEHKQMVPKYLEESKRRFNVFLHNEKY